MSVLAWLIVGIPVLVMAGFFSLIFSYLIGFMAWGLFGKDAKDTEVVPCLLLGFPVFVVLGFILKAAGLLHPIQYFD